MLLNRQIRLTVGELKMSFDKNLNILHITPHLGGGVGSVVMNWMMKDESDTNHKNHLS